MGKLIGQSGHASAQWEGSDLTIGLGSEVRAYAIFGEAPVFARVRYVLATGKAGITVEGGDHDGKQTLVGMGQIVGTDEYRERMAGRNA